MKTVEFDFDASASRMPTDPVELRGKYRESGRMVVLDRAAGRIDHAVFGDIEDYLQPGDLLVLNDSYMLSNTLVFLHESGPAEIIVYGHEPDDTCIVELRGGPPAAPGLTLASRDDPRLTCTILAAYPNALWKARFAPADLLVDVLEQFGSRSDKTVPLNPTYWREARSAYRSVYARKPGSLEIPSAGLHFSDSLLHRIGEKGVEIATITLHVGATEILAVRQIGTEEIEHHKVRPEFFEVSAAAAAQIARAKAAHRRVVAVGTTVMRTLETVALRTETLTSLQPQSGWSDLYIYPGFTFRIVDALLTNLHRPRSSHIVLTAAFAGRDLVMRSYAEILADGGYEFDMFGDSMLIL